MTCNMIKLNNYLDDSIKSIQLSIVRSITNIKFILIYFDYKNKYVDFYKIFLTIVKCILFEIIELLNFITKAIRKN